MAWTTPRTWAVSEVVTAAMMNQHIRDNLNMTAPALVTTKGDLVAATGANALARVGVGGDGEFPISDSAQTAGVAWAPFKLMNDISPSALGADQTDWNPSGLSTASVIRASATGVDRNIYSMATGADGRVVQILNVGTTLNLVIVADDGTTGTATMRFAMTTNLTIGPKSGAIFWYDSTSSRWRPAASAGGTGITIEELDGTPTGPATKLLLPNGTLSFAGTTATYTPGTLLSVVNKSANYTATSSDDVILCDASGGAFTITLPTAVGITGKVYTVIKVDSSANAVTVDANGSQTINGSLTQSLATQWASISLLSDNANWEATLSTATVTLYYQTLRGNNTPATQRGKANFVDTNDVTWTLTDDSGNDETEITAAVGAAKGARVNHSTTQSISNATDTALNFDSERFDTDSIHYTSSANLTGTVSKAGTTTLTGSGTSFSTELSVGQVISVPGGGGTEVRVVTAIASNTSLTVNTAFANTASGQTATRLNSPLVCRTAGKYHIGGGIQFAGNATGRRELKIRLNDATTIAKFEDAASIADDHDMSVSTLYDLSQWDYVELVAYQNSTGSLNSQVNANAAPEFWMTRQAPSGTGAGGGGGGTQGTPALTLSTTNSAGSSGQYVGTDATVAAFDSTVPVTQAFGDAAATGSAGKAARRDHVHGMPANPSGVTLIADTTMGSDATSVTFSSIPGSYKHLRIHMQAASDQAGAVAVYIRFNSDSGNNYDYDFNQTIGGANSPGETRATAQMRVGTLSGTNNTNSAASGVIDIPNYAGTSWHKQAVSHLAGANLASFGDWLSITAGGNWRSTSAITSVTILVITGNMKTNSRFTLYGYQ